MEGEARKVLFAWLTGRSTGRDAARRDSLNIVFFLISDEREEKGNKKKKKKRKKKGEDEGR